MDFSLSPEQRGLIDSTRALLADHGALAVTRALADSDAALDDAALDSALWRRGVDLGWTAIAVAEERGGLGLQLVEQTLVAIEHGQSLATVPFLPTALVSEVLARSDRFTDVLDSVLAGQIVAVAFAERGRPWSIDGLQMRATASNDRVVLNGAKASVQDAAAARWLLVDLLLDGAPARLLVPRDTAGITVTQQKTLDDGRAFYDVSFDDVDISSEAVLCTPKDSAGSIERSLNIAAVLTCAETVGIGRALLDMTVRYVTEREQFGRPVGSFQAVKHKCADMRIWLQAATASTYYAAMAIDAELAQTAFAVSAAKSYVSTAINRLAGEALQLHGGVGFTWEHDLHLYLRRARSNSVLFGDATHHRELLCRQAAVRVTH